MKRKKFIHRFKGGIVATLTVIIENDALTHVACDWNRKMTPKRIAATYPEYQTWMNETLRQLEAETGYCFPVVLDRWDDAMK